MTSVFVLTTNMITIAGGEGLKDCKQKKFAFFCILVFMILLFGILSGNRFVSR